MNIVYVCSLHTFFLQDPIKWKKNNLKKRSRFLIFDSIAYFSVGLRANVTVFLYRFQFQQLDICKYWLMYSLNIFSDYYAAETVLSGRDRKRKKNVCTYRGNNFRCDISNPVNRR